MDKIKADSKITDIDEQIIESSEGIERFWNIRAKSCQFIVSWFDWDFDWRNSRLMMLKTKKGECRVGFYFEKYFITGKEKIIPVLNKPGWICCPDIRI